MQKYRYKGISERLLSLLLVLSIIIPSPVIFLSFPSRAEAAVASIRQEINITDAYYYAPSGSYATTSEIVLLDDVAYTGATYYFEVVASTTSATPATISLVNATSGEIVKSVTANGTSYVRYRSGTAFTPQTGPTEYTVKLGSESVGKGIIAARIVILQSGTIINTQTQIEIGSATTSAVNTNTLPLVNPKYWYYDSTKWDASPTFYAEVTYKDNPTASSTTYNVSATTTTTFHTYVASAGVGYAVVEAWGPGGGGDGASSGATIGGGGGGGGAYVRSTTTPTVGSSYLAGIGRGGAEGTTVTASTTLSSGATILVQAAGGSGANNATGGAGGTVADSTGDVESAGGSGGNGHTDSDVGGGGGGAAGPDGNGVTAANAASTVPSAGGRGDNNLGGLGGAAGTGDNDVCANAGGKAGDDNVLGGGGGGGADGDGTGVCTGGNGGRPGGGGGGSDEGVADHLGGPGRIKLTEYIGTVGIALEKDNGSFGGWTFVQQIVVAGKTSTTSERIRSAAFVPETGLNYRIVASTTNSTASYDIYNAKIVVDQLSSPTLLEPQYLLANKLFTAGTALQDYDTLWDPAEWTTLNVYIHEGNSAAGGTSDIKLQNTSGPADITGSDITDVIQRERSTALTMPASSATIDVVATTNNADLYASRILVQVQVADTVAPTPSPMTFATAPNDASASSISMVASTATDADTPPVAYLFGYFACASNNGTGGSASDWQSGTSYTDSGLQANQCYGYKVQARDSASTPNKTASSTQAEAYTAANTPGAPSFSSPTATTLTLAHNANGNPSASPATKFAVQVVATSPTDSTWLNQYVDSAGNPAATAQWLTDAQLDSLVFLGLSPNTEYTIRSMARNEDLDETASSTATVATTTPGTPGTPTFGNVTQTTLTVSWTAPAGGATSYKIERCPVSSCSFTEIQAGVTDLFFNDSGLSADTAYRYRVRATNAGGDGAYSATADQTTLRSESLTARIIRLLGGARLRGGVRLR